MSGVARRVPTHALFLRFDTNCSLRLKQFVCYVSKLKITLDTKIICVIIKLQNMESGVFMTIEEAKKIYSSFDNETKEKVGLIGTIYAFRYLGAIIKALRGETNE